MSQPFYTVGQFSQICNLTTEQLRYYDKKKIFCPSVRDDDTGYRYYTAQQIEDILLLKNLKELGLPLKSISILIKNKELFLIQDYLKNNLQQVRTELRLLQEKHNHIVDTLLRITEAINVINTTQNIEDSCQHQGFSIVSVPQRTIVSTRYNSNSTIFSTFIERYAELSGILETENYSCDGVISAIFHNHFAQQFYANVHEQVGDLEIFMNLTTPGRSTKHCREFGGFTAAMAVHIGDYKYTEKTYRKLNQWSLDQGYHPYGISFQEFVIGRTVTNVPENFITKIYLPLEQKNI